MVARGILTGMRGVYLVAAELSRLGFIASPTSRSAQGADILVTDQSCKQAFSVQVKTNARTFNFWLLNKDARKLVSDTHVYVLVNLRKNNKGEAVEYYIVPSRVIADKMVHEINEKSEWYSFKLKDALPYKDGWELFGN